MPRRRKSALWKELLLVLRTSCVMDYHRELSGLGRRCDPLPNTAAGVAVPADPGRSARGPSVRRSRQDACPTRLALLALRLEEGNLDTDT